jgi:hypothetical protein
VATEQPRVEWTRTFEGAAAMNVERLVWIPNDAVAVLGRGKRAPGRRRPRRPARRHARRRRSRHGAPREPDDFHNEPVAIAVDVAGTAAVLGWQHWHGDGRNDEDVMRLRFTSRP